jgi:translation initiation factor 4B
MTGVCFRIPRRPQCSKLTFVVQGYHSIRDNLPQELPDKPPFTAHLGNLSYDATEETVVEFFEGCNILNVRIIEDRELMRPKGFAYAEFGDLEGLKTALTRDGQTFQGRTIRIKVAEPRKFSPSSPLAYHG